MSETVIGVDGCPAGWIAILWQGNHIRAKLFELGRFSEILSEDAAMIAVDMPIGFPTHYGRNADIQARKFMKPFGSRVFPVPCREAVHAASYTEAIHINRSCSNNVSIPPVTNAIRPRMQEIDLVITPQNEHRLKEIHPEVSFAVMNGSVPLLNRKKTESGEAVRLELLKAQGFPECDFEKFGFRRRDVKRDDIIDACAAAWSARRILEGKARHFPEVEERDARGLLMRIHA